VIGEHIEIRTVTSARLGSVKVDPGQMEQILVNLVVNARDAMPDGGTITIETANVEIDAEYAAAHADVTAGSHVMVAVTDTGVGIDEATRQRIFEPFFTTKEIGKGTGLGLATVFGIVKQSGGHVWVYSEVGKGTVFKVYLPRADGEPPVLSLPPAAITAATGTETVLLVEDDEHVRQLARNILKRAGYQIIDAPNGREAFVASERFSGTIHLLLTDLVMPEMGGRDLAERLAVLRPRMKVLLVSGYTDDEVVRSGGMASGFGFLQKPFTPSSLTAKVREILDAK